MSRQAHLIVTIRDKISAFDYLKDLYAKDKDFKLTLENCSSFDHSTFAFLIEDGFIFRVDIFIYLMYYYAFVSLKNYMERPLWTLSSCKTFSYKRMLLLEFFKAWCLETCAEVYGLSKVYHTIQNIGLYTLSLVSDTPWVDNNMGFILGLLCTLKSNDLARIFVDGYSKFYAKRLQLFLMFANKSVAQR